MENVNKQRNKPHCQVPGCIEAHSRHYCKKCGAADSTHRSVDCQGGGGHKAPQGGGGHNTPQGGGGHKAPQGGGGHNATQGGGKNPPHCKVPGCTEAHPKHFCKKCSNSDSDHRSSECQPTPPAKGFTALFKSKKVAKLSCKVPDCQEVHDRHYCKVCGEGNSDHRSADCKSGALRSPKQKPKQPLRCKVPDCLLQHGHHTCETCGISDSDHLSKNCPHLVPRGPPPTSNKPLRCKVPDCLLQHGHHTCETCGVSDSDHLSKNCPHLVPRGPSPTSNMGAAAAHCRVPNCTQQHAYHLCETCGDDDADHFTVYCVQSNPTIHHQRTEQNPNYTSHQNPAPRYEIP